MRDWELSIAVVREVFEIGVFNVVLLQVYIQYVKQVQAVDPQFVAINRDLDSLLHIADELALHAASYPPLTDIKPGADFLLNPFTPSYPPLTDIKPGGAMIIGIVITSLIFL